MFYRGTNVRLGLGTPAGSDVELDREMQLSIHDHFEKRKTQVKTRSVPARTGVPVSAAAALFARCPLRPVQSAAPYKRL
jgi:hypothetical protein